MTGNPRSPKNPNRALGRRRFLRTTGVAVGAGLIAGCLGGGDGDGSSFPENNIELIIPYSTGGGFDYYGRLAAKHLGERDPPLPTQPQNVTPDIAGHNEIYRAEPDGYTIGITSLSSMSKAQVLQEEAEFDLTEMTHFPRIAGSVEAVAVGPHTDISSGNEFIDAMAAGDLKVHSESLTGGSALDLVGLGAIGGVYSEDRVIDNWVQYDGTGEAVAGIRRQEIDAMATSISSLLQYIDSGDVEPVLLLTRRDSYPEVAPEGIDTLDDVPVDDPDAVIGFLGVEFDRVFAGPPDIPDEETSIIRGALDEVIQSDELQREAEENDRPILYASSDEVTDAVESSVQVAREQQDLLERLFRADG